MKLNNIWGYGQLFGFSAIEGPNRYYDDFVGTLTNRKIEIRFELIEWVKIYFPFNNIVLKSVMSDFIEGTSPNGDFFITFADNDTLVGYSPVVPRIHGERDIAHSVSWDIDIYSTNHDYFGVALKKEKSIYKFAIHHSFSLTEARSGANRFINVDIESLREKRYAYYKQMPKCKNDKYEMLYYKALSVNKVNVHSPEGNIKCLWTTPDRVPHRHMWLWDSVFHALSFLTYNKDIAKSAIEAVISQQREDGFIAHMANPTDISDITQPQVLSWGVWEVYKKTKDIDFLRRNVDKLDKYLSWDIKNRDNNNNGLLEWFTEPDYDKCKCGESGLDNSPRFDFDVEMDAIDFSTFSARDAKYLSYIYKELNNQEKANEWMNYYEEIKKKINVLMWDEETGAYYDRLFTGELTKVITPASFLPMFAEIPSIEQAKKMVKMLTRTDLLWTPFPVSTIESRDKSYSTDMWRGGAWLNLNYFVIKGLLNYGYYELANELKDKTLKNVNEWFEKTGVIYEFYDSQNKVPPYKCDRKGQQPLNPDWRVHVHSISDFNWSSCFVILFIQNELY